MRSTPPVPTAILAGLLLPSCLPEPVPAEPFRLIEPILPEAPVRPPAADARRVRLRAVTARAHLRQPLLHQAVDGSMWEDDGWLWTVSPAEYLAEVLEDCVAAEPAAVAVDRDPDLDVEVLLQAFQVVDDAEGPGFIVTARVRVMGQDGGLRIGTVAAGLPRQPALPGDLATVSGVALAEVARGIVAFVLGRSDGG